MEYSATVTITATGKPNNYIARVFVYGEDEGLNCGNEQVHESHIYIQTPTEETEALDWAALCLALVRNHLSDERRACGDPAMRKVMSDLFRQQGHFIN